MALPPQFGFKVKLNHKFPETWKQNVKVRIGQIWGLVTLGIRYFIYWAYIKIKGRTPLMDYFNVQNGKQIYGVPLGGIGSGSIGRGFRGEFCRFQLRPGICNYKVMHGNQFIVTIRDPIGKCLYQKVLSTAPKPDYLNKWDWTYDGEDATYVGLYPRAWTTYNIPEENITLQCRQISPVIPHNYKDSCLPCAVFDWTVWNNGLEEKLVSITFTFQNGIGEKSDFNQGCWTESYTDEHVSGALIHHQVDDMPYTYAITASRKGDVETSVLRVFDPLGNGDDVWKPLRANGNFLHWPESETINPTKKGHLRGSAVCAQLRLYPSECKAATFSLAWDMPKVHFGEGRRNYYRIYTRHYGRDGAAAPMIAKHAIYKYHSWEKAIAHWQKSVLADSELPSWYKSALFNETYYISDGGTLWFDVRKDERDVLTPGDPRLKFGRFAYLEGHEYRMYNTYDVHFYASFALAMNWPVLQASLQRDFADSISQSNPHLQWHLFDGGISARKKPNSIPHDIGDPGEEPFIKINAYPIHDVSEWRDLNLKYVLQCYRDYSISNDLTELKYHWPNMQKLMMIALKWDTDGDGLIENHGCPDQTYDTWTMTGPSAYCGSLWLAALQVTLKTAQILQQTKIAEEYAQRLKTASTAFVNKLWNGSYFNFDCSSGSGHTTIMSDQLCGLWYLLASGLPNEILPPEHVQSALKTIFTFNVEKFNNGKSGAVNGMRPDGKVDLTTIQSEETWTGVVYALSSLLLFQNMTKEGFQTASGIYKTVYERIGMGFETPEALYSDKVYRAIGYMRPLSIWSMQLAISINRKDVIEDNYESEDSDPIEEA